MRKISRRYRKNKALIHSHKITICLFYHNQVLTQYTLQMMTDSKQKIILIYGTCRNQDILKRYVCLSIWLLYCWNNGPQRNEHCPKKLMLGEGKDISHSPNNLSDHLIRGDWSPDTNGSLVARATPWPDYLDVQILGLLFKLKADLKSLQLSVLFAIWPYWIINLLFPLCTIESFNWLIKDWGHRLFNDTNI